MMNRCALILAISALSLTTITSNTYAQVAATNSGGEVKKLNSTVMIVPNTKANEDIRTIIDENPEMRLILNKLKDEFDLRGVKTVDFVAKLKSTQANLAFTSDNKTDFKTALIANSGADIYVTTDIVVHNDPTNGTLVRLDMNAFETQSGYNLGNKIGESKRVITDDINRLTEQAINSVVEDLLNTIYNNFSIMLEDGRSIQIYVGFEENSELNMDSEVGPDNKTIGTLLEEFMDLNAYKNQYRMGGASDIQIIFDEVKIPFFDQATGKNYNPNKFATEINKFLKELGVQSSRNVKGNVIQIKIK